MEFVHVKKKLPPNLTRVIALIGSRRTLKFAYYEEPFDEWWVEDVAVPVAGVTYWAPIPELPKRETKG